MPLHASSYFAGVGTVVATIALGFGAGVMMTDAFVGKSENPPTLTERRATPLSESTAPVVTTAQSAPVAAAPETQATAPPPASAPAPQQAAAPPSPTPAPQAVRELQPQPEQAIARAQEVDVRTQEAETKKALAAERRKDERRKWAERRKRELQKIDEMHAIAEKVRQAEREREPVIRSFFAESPRIRLFEDD